MNTTRWTSQGVCAGIFIKDLSNLSTVDGEKKKVQGTAIEADFTTDPRRGMKGGEKGQSQDRQALLHREGR